MALALLRLEDVAGDRTQFQVELGRNQWYVYAIGDETTDRVHGIELLANPSTTSPLFGPLPPQARGRTTLEVPVAEFDREKRFMQLMSFRTERREGPAVSDIVTIPPGVWRLQQGRRVGGTAGSLSRARRVAAYSARGTVPFRLVEAAGRPEYSTAMWWQLLLQALPMVAPIISNLLGGLFKSGGSGEGGGGGGILGDLAGGIGTLLKDPKAQNLIGEIIKAATSSGAGGAGAAAKSLSIVSLPEPLARAQFVDGGVITGPALMGLIAGALPALMPLLHHAASPEMVGTVFTGLSPERTLAPTIDTLMDPNRRQFERLWLHTPQVGPNVLPTLLMQMERNIVASPVPRYRRVTSVTLGFEGLEPQTIHGTSRVVFRSGRDVSLAITVAAPKPIPRAELHWQVKHPITLATLAHGVERKQQVGTDKLTLVIPATALASLTVPEEYLVCVTLVWRSTKGTRLGTRRSVILTLAGEYLFDRIEDLPELEGTDQEEGPPREPIALSDAGTYRDFWHKIWEGTLTQQGRSRAFECKYYYALEERRGIARMESRMKRVKGPGGTTVTRLKTGLLLSPGALNTLLPALGPAPALEPEHLAAIRSPDFRRRFAQAALSRVTIRGRAGERAALWVYPELKLQRVVLKRADTVSDAGQVTTFTEVPVVFPVPALAHFVGTRTER